MPSEEPGQNSDELRSLERMNQRLYSPQANTSFTPPSLPIIPVSTPASPVASPEAWKPPAQPTPSPKKKRISWSIMFLIVAVVFFVVAGGVSFFFLAQGGRAVSSNNITLNVTLGSTTITSGTAVPLIVTIKNTNPAAITNANVTLNFPDGTRSATDVTQPLVRYPLTIGTMQAGATVTQTVQAVLFGSANQSITIPVTFQYNTANSDALFTKTQDFTFTIASSPLTITANTVKSVASGQNFSIMLAVRSNATTPLNNIAVAAQYPSGFTVKNGSSATSTALFTIGTLTPGQEKDITINGSLTGSDNDLRDFEFTVGIPQGDGTPSLSVAYGSEQAAVTIIRPFLAATISINDQNTDPTVVTATQDVTGTLTWLNTLASTITNAQITLAFSGTAFDPNSVTASDGYYNSASHVLTFNGTTDQRLSELQAGGTDNSSFNFASKSNSALASLRNPTIQISASVSGEHDGETTPETVTNTFTRTIEIATDLELASRIVYSTGPFKNTGPLPPKVNQSTTYTVLLSVTNTVNDVAGATVSMILPPYVTFTNQVTPSDGSITYDDATRTVTWKVGSVPAGTGSGSSPLTAAFQVSFMPSSSQANTSPVLVGNQTISGTDRFTNEQVGMTQSALTTETSSDPAYNPSFGEVSN